VCTIIMNKVWKSLHRIECGFAIESLKLTDARTIFACPSNSELIEHWIGRKLLQINCSSRLRPLTWLLHLLMSYYDSSVVTLLYWKIYASRGKAELRQKCPLLPDRVIVIVRRKVRKLQKQLRFQRSRVIL
jgi:hypothetical protein